jgi:hypothetical protein
MSRHGRLTVNSDYSCHISQPPAFLAMTPPGPYASSRPAHAGAAGGDGACTKPPTLPFPDPDSVAVRDQLEELDDAMFGAMDGAPGAVEKARALWFNAVASLPWSLIEESREQYLRYAAEVLSRPAPHARNPEASLGALEVMELLARAA